MRKMQEHGLLSVAPHSWGRGAPLLVQGLRPGHGRLLVGAQGEAGASLCGWGVLPSQGAQPHTEKGLLEGRRGQPAPGAAHVGMSWVS